MEMLIKSPQIKKISFEDYEKYFKHLLDNPDINNIMFYKQNPEKFVITFSWDSFIIFTEITTSQILKKYQDSNLDTFDVVASETPNEHPVIKKFIAEYLGKAIPEV